MKKQKYKDMAYGNNRGRAWLRLIHSKIIWDKWLKITSNHLSAIRTLDKNCSAKILTAAIWHFGFANDKESSRTVRATARRLRRGDAPPDGGRGESSRDLCVSELEMRTYGMPMEFWLLENFLEYEVRPRMDGSVKTE